MNPTHNRSVPEDVKSGFYLGKDLAFGIIRDGKLIVAHLTPNEARSVAAALVAVAREFETKQQAVQN